MHQVLSLFATAAYLEQFVAKFKQTKPAIWTVLPTHCAHAAISWVWANYT